MPQIYLKMIVVLVVIQAPTIYGPCVSGPWSLAQDGLPGRRPASAGGRRRSGHHRLRGSDPAVVGEEGPYLNLKTMPQQTS